MSLLSPQMTKNQQLARLQEEVAILGEEAENLLFDANMVLKEMGELRELIALMEGNK